MILKMEIVIFDRNVFVRMNKDIIQKFVTFDKEESTRIRQEDLNAKRSGKISTAEYMHR